MTQQGRKKMRKAENEVWMGKKKKGQRRIKKKEGNEEGRK